MLYPEKRNGFQSSLLGQDLRWFFVFWGLFFIWSLLSWEIKRKKYPCLPNHPRSCPERASGLLWWKHQMSCSSRSSHAVAMQCAWPQASLPLSCISSEDSTEVLWQSRLVTLYWSDAQRTTSAELFTLLWNKWHNGIGLLQRIDFLFFFFKVPLKIWADIFYAQLC